MYHPVTVLAVLLIGTMCVRHNLAMRISTKKWLPLILSVLTSLGQQKLHPLKPFSETWYAIQPVDHSTMLPSIGCVPLQQYQSYYWSTTTWHSAGWMQMDEPAILSTMTLMQTWALLTTKQFSCVAVQCSRTPAAISARLKSWPPRVIMEYASTVCSILHLLSSLTSSFHCFRTSCGATVECLCQSLEVVETMWLLLAIAQQWPPWRLLLC